MSTDKARIKALEELLTYAEKRIQVLESLVEVKQEEINECDLYMFEFERLMEEKWMIVNSREIN